MEVAKGTTAAEAQAFVHLVEQYQTALLRICYIYLQDRSLAEDAVQETFLKAFKSMHSFRGDCSEKTWLIRIAMNTCHDTKRSSWFRHTDRRVTPELLPEPEAAPSEDVDIPYEDTLRFCYTEIQRLFGLSADQLHLEVTDICEGQYYFHKEKGEKIWEKRANDFPGFWSFYFEQLFHGIPMVSCEGGNVYDDYFDIQHAGTPGIGISVWDSDTCWVDSITRRELAIMYDDVPIKSFADAKAAIESEIMSGHLRRIDLVRLCYILYIDPSDSSVFWLLPTWYLEGVYAKYAQRDLEPVYSESDDLVGYRDANDCWVVAYEANGGKLIGRKETSSKRRNVPKIVTWNEVK